MDKAEPCKTKGQDEIDYLRAEIANVNKSFAMLQQQLLERTTVAPPPMEVESYRTVRGKEECPPGQSQLPVSDSVTTIYQDAVEKRTSSSSEDWIDTSDELSPGIHQAPQVPLNAVADLQNKFQHVTQNFVGKERDAASQIQVEKDGKIVEGSGE